jgi:hypothetical protein
MDLVKLATLTATTHPAAVQVLFPRTQLVKWGLFISYD